MDGAGGRSQGRGQFRLTEPEPAAGGGVGISSATT